MKYKIGLFNESFPPSIDGVANCVYNYAKEITAKKGDCVVVTPEYPGVKDNYPFRVYRYPSYDIAKRFGYRVGNVLSFKLRRDLKKEQFDLVHIHSPFASSVIASQLRRKDNRFPIVLTYHTRFDLELDKRAKSAWFRRAGRWFILRNLHAADEVWIVTHRAAQFLRDVGYKGPYRVMYNGTDFPKGKAPAQNVAALREKLGLKSSFTFLYVGRMMWYKNIKLILDALKRIGDKVDYQMVFVGGGDDLPAIKAYAKRLRLHKKIIFTGAVYDREAVRTYFSAADLFLFPSTYDTSGLVVKEAAACAVPCVLVRDACTAENAVDGENSFLCEENAGDLSKCILRAVQNKALLQSVGENAQRDLYLSWEDAVRAACQRYEELIAERKRKNE